MPPAATHTSIAGFSAFVTPTCSIFFSSFCNTSSPSNSFAKGKYFPSNFFLARSSLSFLSVEVNVAFGDAGPHRQMKNWLVEEFLAPDDANDSEPYACCAWGGFGSCSGEPTGLVQSNGHGELKRCLSHRGSLHNSQMLSPPLPSPLVTSPPCRTNPLTYRCTGELM